MVTFNPTVVYGIPVEDDAVDAEIMNNKVRGEDEKDGVAYDPEKETER